ncbi:MAG: LD-carboxypeptidase [Deltaproteobacteria bacterium]|nr:LD-carboxypeptidase [Deltaproteobacteria bacterium]
MLKLTALQPGDRIAIAAPASPFDKIEFEKGIHTLQQLGFHPFFREDLFSKNRYLAGKDERREEELIDFLKDPEIKAILFARGGYGCLRLLPTLNSHKEKFIPKIILGYSDITTLLLFFQQTLKWPVFHGPVVAKAMGDSFSEAGKKSLMQILTQRNPLGFCHPSSLNYFQGGKAEGIFTGGCLSLLCASLGSPYEVQTKGKILFLEDTQEKLYKIDRMLTQLKLAQKLDSISGLILGPFEHCDAPYDEIINLVVERVGRPEIPMLAGLPTGHQDNMQTFPMGVTVQIDSQTEGINFIESPFL